VRWIPASKATPAWALLALSCVLAPAPAHGERKPNIVLLLIDDMGWRDAGYAGSDFYETPRIDALAREGMSFTDAYACAATCAPSRACLLSGQYPVRHGVYSVFPLDNGPAKRMRVVPAEGRRALSGDTVTIAERLKRAGYVTGMFGKWNLGGNATKNPWAQGFDTVHWLRRPDGSDPATRADPGAIREITNAAQHFMEANRDRPFFALISHHAIHRPHGASAERREKYESKAPGEQHSNAPLAAMLEELDASVGAIEDRIAKLGLTRHTLVLLTSDNGGLSVSSQAPLRGFKGSLYEGGIRVPLLARWPGVIAPGSTTSVPVDNVDIYPTLLQVAGLSPDADGELDGTSLVPLFADPKSDLPRTLFWHFPGYLAGRVEGARDPWFQARPVTVARKGPWKLHLFHEEWALDGGREKRDTNRALELYDLQKDPGEAHDVAAATPERRDELLEEILRFRRATNAPVPNVPNPAYEPLRARRPAPRARNDAAPPSSTRSTVGATLGQEP